MHNQGIKKFVAVFVTIGAFLMLTSCSVSTIVFRSLIKMFSSEIPLAYSFSKSEMEDARALMDEANEIVSAGTAPYEDLASVLDELWEAYLHLETTEAKLKVNYDYNSNRTVQIDSVRIDGYYTEFKSFIHQFNVAVADSIYCHDYYEDETASEIAEFVRLETAYSSKTYQTLSDELAEIASSYEDYTESDDDWSQEVAELYAKYIKKADEIRSFLGYDNNYNYYDYLSETQYNRCYAAEALASVETYVINYLVPLGKMLLARTPSSSSMNTFDFLNAQAYFYKNYKEEGYADDLSDYVSYLGDKAGTCYDLLYGETGYAIFGYTFAAEEGAYTVYLYDEKAPVCYFGPSYQSIDTVIHEFGHAFSMYQAEDDGGDYDLAEAQAQANELLFLSWFLKQTDTGLSKEARLMIRNKYLMQMIGTVINCLCIAEFEDYLYQNPTTPAASFDSIFMNIVKKYGEYDAIVELIGTDPLDYWRRVVISDAGYYQSYGISAIVALEVYALALQPTTESDKAKSDYLKLTAAPSDATFIDALTAAGLKTPFMKETYTTIESAINGLYPA